MSVNFGSSNFSIVWANFKKISDRHAQCSIYSTEPTPEEVDEWISQARHVLYALAYEKTVVIHNKQYIDAVLELDREWSRFFDEPSNVHKRQRILQLVTSVKAEDFNVSCSDPHAVQSIRIWADGIKKYVSTNTIVQKLLLFNIQCLIDRAYENEKNLLENKGCSGPFFYPVDSIQRSIRKAESSYPDDVQFIEQLRKVWESLGEYQQVIFRVQNLVQALTRKDNQG